MTTKNDLSKTSVDDLLGMFKSPEKVKAQGKCTFVRKIDLLPQNVQDAVYTACANKDITTREILAFVNTKTDVKVNLTMIQDHRHREGCVVCLYGTPRK